MTMTFDYDDTSLEALLAHCWARLETALSAPGDPFRTAVLGTRADDGVALRTVVIREVDVPKRQLVCNTDRRTAKISELTAAPTMSWLFWDPSEQVQLRLRGHAQVLTARSATQGYWDRLPPVSHRNFLTVHPPGTPAGARTTDLPAELAHDTAPRPEHSDKARENFAVIESTIEAIDWVRLHPSGNARANFAWHDAQWSGRWTVP